MKKLIVANWKMNYPDAKNWHNFRVSKKVEIVVCPPFTYLRQVASMRWPERISVGAQDVFWEEKGAYTGEISPTMLTGIGVRYVIIGHSERRLWLRETDEMINKKVAAALKAGLKVVLCVGEPLKVRQKGIAVAKAFVGNQLRKDLKKISGFRLQVAGLIVAYEPIWAIGTGRADLPEGSAAMAKFIREKLSSIFRVSGSALRVLYGGSVDAGNASEFLREKEIDGALVGGASLKRAEFQKIINAAF